MISDPVALRGKIETLRTDALAIFNVADCTQEVRDAIEWYHSSLMVMANEAEDDESAKPQDDATWCQYVAGMVSSYLSTTPADVHPEAREIAIGRIIRRRIMFLAPYQDASTPEARHARNSWIMRATRNQALLRGVAACSNSDPNGKKPSGSGEWRTVNLPADLWAEITLVHESAPKDPRTDAPYFVTPQQGWDTNWQVGPVCVVPMPAAPVPPTAELRALAGFLARSYERRMDGDAMREALHWSATFAERVIAAGKLPGASTTDLMSFWHKFAAARKAWANAPIGSITPTYRELEKARAEIEEYIASLSKVAAS